MSHRVPHPQKKHLSSEIPVSNVPIEDASSSVPVSEDDGLEAS